MWIPVVVVLLWHAAVIIVIFGLSLLAAVATRLNYSLKLAGLHRRVGAGHSSSA